MMKKVKKKKNVKEVAKNGLCMGCGTCRIICPEGAIRIRLSNALGRFVPTINSHFCTNCGMCLSACPGYEVNFADLSKMYLNKEADDYILGAYKNCYVGHAVQHELRYNAASGGIITSLCIYALNERIIDSVVLCSTTEENPLQAKYIKVRSKEEVLRAAGSIYSPTTMDFKIDDILNTEEKIAIVGLPCHIHGIRKLEKIIPKLRCKIVFHFGLFCANNNSYFGTERFLTSKGIDLSQISSILYRGKGWPGWIVAKLKNGSAHSFRRGTTERRTLPKILFSSSFHYDFMIPRCLLCPDLTNELADISFGDPWNKKHLKKETVGKSMFITRNDCGEDIIQKLQEDKKIIIENIDSKEVKKSQNLRFKSEVGSRLYIRKQLGLAIPGYYGKSIARSMHGYISYGYYLFSYLSHIKLFWPIVKFVSHIRFLWIKANKKLRIFN